MDREGSHTCAVPMELVWVSLFSDTPSLPAIMAIWLLVTFVFNVVLCSPWTFCHSFSLLGLFILTSLLFIQILLSSAFFGLLIFRGDSWILFLAVWNIDKCLPSLFILKCYVARFSILRSHLFPVLKTWMAPALWHWISLSWFPQLASICFKSFFI